MKIVPEPLNSEEREQLNYGCYPILNKFHLIFESWEEADRVKTILERLLEEEK